MIRRRTLSCISSGILLLSLTAMCPALGRAQYHPAQLVGTWELQTPQGSFSLVLNPDGKGVFNGREMRWAFNQGTLVLVGPAGELVYKASVTADTLTLSGGGLTAPAIWKRARGGGSPPGVPASGLAGMGRQAPARVSAPSGPVGTWEAPGPQGVVSMVFNADGTGTFNGEQGTWTYSRGTLRISGASGATFAYTAAITPTSLTLSGANLSQPLTFQRLGADAGGASGEADVGTDQAAAPATVSSGPVGIWEMEGKTGAVRMDLRPDGSGVFAGENVRWQFNQGVLSIARENGTTYMYNATLAPDSITLSSAGLGRPVTFRRVSGGEEQGDLVGSALSAAGPGASQAEGVPQAAAGLIGKWQGKTGLVEITANGTFIFPGGNSTPYTVEGDALTLRGTDGVLRFRYNLSGATLTLTTDKGQSLTFTRVSGGVQ